VPETSRELQGVSRQYYENARNSREKYRKKMERNKDYSLHLRIDTCLSLAKANENRWCMTIE